MTLAVNLLLVGSPALATCPDSTWYGTDFNALELGALPDGPQPTQDKWYASLRVGGATAEIQAGVANPGRALFLNAPLANPSGLQTIARRDLALVDLSNCAEITLAFDFLCTTSNLSATNMYSGRVYVTGGPHPGYSIIEVFLTSGNGSPKSAGIDVGTTAFDQNSQINFQLPLTVGQNLSWNTWHSVALKLDHSGDRFIQITVDGQTQNLGTFMPPRSCNAGTCARGQRTEQLSVEVVPNDSPAETLDGIYVDNVQLRTPPTPVILPHKLAVVYVVPTDVPYNPIVHAELKRATASIQAWYQCASGGLTWELSYPDTVTVYHAQNSRLYYVNNGDWWGSLPIEMGAVGFPTWTPGTVVAIWAHGAGFWAGSGQGCAGECGVALLGVELFPQFNNPSYSGGNCPGGTGVAAWPCTPVGAFAHELGHTLGLPHPSDVPATSAVASHSIMETHWNYPNFATGGDSPWGFLSLERQTLLANPFMKWNVPLRQTHAGCDVVNLPDLGNAPDAAFTTTGSYYNKFVGTNLSTGAAYSYWTFGDSGVSNETNPTHYYTKAGAHLVTLRSMAASCMVDTTARARFVTGVSDEPTNESTVRPAVFPAAPNPFGGRTTIGFSSSVQAAVEMAVFDVAGRRVRTKFKWECAGPRAMEWDGDDDQGVPLASGVYFIRVTVGGARYSQRVVLLR